MHVLDTENRSRFVPEDAPSGLVILVDKPEGWTSFDVVNKVRSLLRKRLGLKKIKVGHAGTLDPMATGLLLLCTGSYTPLLESLQAESKEYTGTLTLGARTASFDRETPEEDPRPWQHLQDADIQRALPALTGQILQRPPLYSAIRVNGQRAYLLARKGKETELPLRPVTIFRFEADGNHLPFVSFRIQCSKGTYIRSLAHDLGQMLGCGAYLSALRREAIGTYPVSKALSLIQFEEWCASIARNGITSDG